MVNLRGGRGLSADDLAPEQRLKEEKEMNEKQKQAEVKARMAAREDRVLKVREKQARKENRCVREGVCLMSLKYIYPALWRSKDPLRSLMSRRYPGRRGHLSHGSHCNAVPAFAFGV